MSFLEIALGCVSRGWHVHPLKVADKVPITKHGKNDATISEAQITEWWTRWPNANVGINCGLSGLCVLDADHGLADEAAFIAWRDRNGLPVTYTVRSGRRDEYGVQSYYAGGLKDGKFLIDGVSGEIKSLGGLVMAAGNIHPGTKEAYYVLVDAPVAPVPAIIEQSRKQNSASGKREWSLPVHDGDGRDDFLYSQACKLRHAGASEVIIRAQLEEWNSDRAIMADPKPDEDLQRIARSASRHDVPPPEPRVIIGKPKPLEKTVTDWRKWFHSKDETVNAPPISFLIKDFLQCEGVTGLAAPVRERKSLIALNMVHALLTGEKLFRHFEVTKKPERILYLVPEVSLGPFADRLKKIELTDYVGERLFYRTLSAEGRLSLAEPTLRDALPGSVVFLDTAIRFLEGNENDSGDVRKFADSVFSLLRDGAESVVLLHHSPKDQAGKDQMTLENAMRGSGDMGAFLACCWGTRLQNPDDPYKSASFLTNLKQRDFESQDFEVTCAADCRMTIVGNPATHIVKAARRHGNRGNRDGQDTAAEDLIRANIELSVPKLQELLTKQRIKRGSTWIQKRRARLKYNPDDE